MLMVQVVDAVADFVAGVKAFDYIIAAANVKLLAIVVVATNVGVSDDCTYPVFVVEQFYR